MKFEFFSIKDPKGGTVVDCFKAENTTYCDSPRTPGLDVVKIENTTADQYSRDVFYFTSSYRVSRAVRRFADLEFDRVVHAYPDRYHHMEVRKNPLIVRSSEPFFQKTLRFSHGILGLLKEVVTRDPEWENKKSLSDRDVYRAAIVIVIQEGDKAEVSIPVGVEITVPKSKQLDQKGYPLRFVIGEDEYLYQLQTLPPEIQRAIEKLNIGKTTSA